MALAFDWCSRVFCQGGMILSKRIDPRWRLRVWNVFCQALPVLVNNNILQCTLVSSHASPSAPPRTEFARWHRVFRTGILSGFSPWLVSETSWRLLRKTIYVALRKRREKEITCLYFCDRWGCWLDFAIQRRVCVCVCVCVCVGKSVAPTDVPTYWPVTSACFVCSFSDVRNWPKHILTRT